MSHITVLQQEAVTSLHLQKDSVVIDCTFGSGGHAREILKQLGAQGVYIGIDVDENALHTSEQFEAVTKARVHFVEENFRNISLVLLASFSTIAEKKYSRAARSRNEDSNLT